MASKKNRQTTAKRNREQAVKERRDRKREQKAEAAARRIAQPEDSIHAGGEGSSNVPPSREPPGQR